MGSENETKMIIDCYPKHKYFVLIYRERPSDPYDRIRVRFQDINMSELDKLQREINKYLKNNNYKR